TVYLPGNVPLQMVRILPGSFQMGTADSEADFEPDEAPLHSVNIDYEFYMGLTEISQEQWLALMGKWPGKDPEEKFGLGPDYPAYFVSWYDCQQFAHALNEHILNTDQDSATFRLPSEAEWEFSCRAGTNTRYFFGEGEEKADEYFWYESNSEPGGSRPVAKKKPNPWGLYDIGGNVWEWCEDYYHPNYEGAPDDGSAWLDPKHQYVAVRSGDMGLSAAKCRCANRNDHRKAGDRSEDIGFRLVMTK
ncbi:MAG: formylglycine-generating enzyme family protein, partial [Bacteroidales bacterium]|nr:formylglycine-generating enzyme family protein [Bacteroidales bacterium]